MEYSKLQDELWFPENAPEKIMAIMPTLDSIPVVLEHILEVSPIDPTNEQVHNAINEINKRRKEIYKDYQDGYYDRNPQFLEIGLTVEAAQIKKRP